MATHVIVRLTFSSLLAKQSNALPESARVLFNSRVDIYSSRTQRIS